MLYSGLLSVTFRQLSAMEIVKLVSQAKLETIEWGGDIHVPHGDIKTAREVAKMTRDEGLTTASYGSYYRVGCSSKTGLTFENVLESAIALGAPAIRVWAGDKGSDKADSNYWEEVVTDSRNIAELAQAEGIQIHYEYHQNTLTDSNETTLQLLDRVDHSNVLSNWQPTTEWSVEQRIASLRNLGDKLANIHAFYWEPGIRLPFSNGAQEWEQYISIVQKETRDRYVMLEFVKDNEPEQFLQDAMALKNLISNKK